MGYLYHGSKVSDLKRLEPRQSTHGEFVYATPFKELAYLFSGKAGDDLTQSIYRNENDEPWIIVERIPRGFNIEYDNEASIYTLSDETFKDIHTGFAEVVSEVSVDIIHEEHVKSVYWALLELGKAEVIRIYRYPSRPKGIPDNDSDLLDKTINHIKRNNKEIKQDEFVRLLFLHPNLLDQVNAFLQSNNIPLFKCSDLIDIFKMYVERQQKNPEGIYYLEQAYSSIVALYPEFLSVLDEEMLKFTKNWRKK